MNMGIEMLAFSLFATKCNGLSSVEFSFRVMVVKPGTSILTSFFLVLNMNILKTISGYAMKRFNGKDFNSFKYNYQS